MSKNNLIFDQQQIEIFRHRAALKYKQPADFLLSHVTHDLQYRLADVNRKFSKALDLHSYNNIAANMLKNTIPQVIRAETSELFLQDYEDKIVTAREELTDIPTGFDLIISLLSMQFINNVPLYLKQVISKLKKDGLFLGVLMGEGSLIELKEVFLEAELLHYGGVSPRVAPFMNIQKLGSFIQEAGFTLPVLDVEKLTIEYDNLNLLYHDLRSWGMQNALFDRIKKPITRGFAKMVEDIYYSKFGSIKLSFVLLWFSAWSPCESQAKPAKPGSATVSLADIL